MASSRTAAQRRRARAMASQASRPRTVPSPRPEPQRVEDDDAVWYVPAKRWPAVLGLLICLAGLGVAAYLTWAHYHPTLQLACPENSVLNCEAVTTSAYSKILGIPVALLGLLFFAGMLPLQLPVAWRSPHPYVRMARLGGAIVGVAMIVWLIYAELFGVGKICIYCTSVHILTFLLFVVVVLGTIATSPEPA
jgi:uncharacterized membrane protein